MAPSRLFRPPPDETVRVRFWGVRGSIPSPGPDTVRYGGNTSCVTVEAPGGDLLILDAGSGLRLLGLALAAAGRLPLRAHLLLTHTHWDHIQGFPFFIPAFIPGNEITAYGTAGSAADLHTALAGQMLHRYFPVSLEQLGATLRFCDIGPGTQTLGPARVTAAALHHSGPTLGYRIEAAGRVIAYVTDTEPLAGDVEAEPDPAALELARDADVLIHDCQYTDEEYPAKVGWGHSPTRYVVRVAQAARARRLILFHHDPTRDDDRLEALVVSARACATAAGWSVPIEAAAEGSEITLAEAPQREVPPAPKRSRHRLNSAISAGSTASARATSRMSDARRIRATPSSMAAMVAPETPAASASARRESRRRERTSASGDAAPAAAPAGAGTGNEASLASIC